MIPKDTYRKKWGSSEIQLVFMAMLSVVFLIIFSYAPMAGILLAFKDGDRKLNIINSLFNSEWVDFKNFKLFLTDPDFKGVFFNTIGLNLLMLIINFPAPIIFALLINEVTHQGFKRSIQFVTSFPHFISWIVFGGIIIALTDMTTGVVNPVLSFLGLSSSNNPVNLGNAEYFWAEIIIFSLIKSVGWGSIIYIAAITSIEQSMFEAATLDGASRLQKAVFITIPSIIPTILVLLLLNISRLLGNSFEQFYTLQNRLNISKSEVLATYIYKTGIAQRKYSYAVAMGIFESVISVLLLIISNSLCKKFAGRGLFL